jgi:hypothetical protein
LKLIICIIKFIVSKTHVMKLLVQDFKWFMILPHLEIDVVRHIALRN